MSVDLLVAQRESTEACDISNERTERGILFSRVWAMPSADTFDVPPIAGFVQKYLIKSKVSVDPFSRNKRWTTFTNDINPNTAADNHMKALDFLESLALKNVRADLVIFDPPYSISQAKMCYESFGAQTFTTYDAQNVVRWSDEKRIVNDILDEGGVFLQFGWNTSGLGVKYNCDIEQILLVCHGPAQNDTICVAERKRIPEPTLWDDLS